MFKNNVYKIFLIVAFFSFGYLIETFPVPANASNEGSAEKIEIDNYLPLKEGTIQTSRTKSIMTSGTKVIQESDTGRTYKLIYFPMQEIQGKTVYPVKSVTTITNTPHDHVVMIYYAKDKEGIYIAGTQVIKDNNPKEIKFDEVKKYVLKNPIKVGNEWYFEAWSHLASQLKRPPIKVKMKCTIDNIGDAITVPAGTFKGCVKVSRSGDIILEDKANIKKDFTAWYAPGVGLVKHIDSETMTANGTTMMIKMVNQLESMEK